MKMKAFRRRLRARWSEWRHAQRVRANTRVLSRPIKLAIVGGGKAAQFHLEALKCIGNTEVAALITRGRTDPGPVLKTFGIRRHHTTIEEALRSGIFDAAIIAVPPSATSSIVTEMAAAGVRCLIEKPVALSTTEARPLIDMDQSGNHAVAYNRRFYGSVIRAREVVSSLGAPYSMHIEAPENLHKILVSNGAAGLPWRFVSNTTHALDLFTSFLGPHSQTESLPVYRRLGDLPTSFQTGTRFENGATGTFLAHWRSPGEWTVTLYGELYKVTINLHTNEAILQTVKTGKSVVFKGGIEDHLAKPGILLQDWEFLQAVASCAPVSPPLCTVNSALETLKLAESILFASSKAMNRRLQNADRHGTVAR